jgi:hypothetical protein
VDGVISVYGALVLVVRGLVSLDRYRWLNFADEQYAIAAEINSPQTSLGLWLRQELRIQIRTPLLKIQPKEKKSR